MKAAGKTGRFFVCGFGALPRNLRAFMAFCAIVWYNQSDALEFAGMDSE